MISVIIPVYNTEKYIDRCIESIINQSEKDLEIILIDDCSSDNSRAKLEKWEEKDSRIRVIYKTKNEGVSAARNDGILASKGEYISFIDSDDYICDEFFSRLLFHLNNTGADIAFGRFRRVYEDHSEDARCTRNTGEILNLEEAAGYCIPKIRTKWFDGYIWDKLYRKNVVFGKDGPVLFDGSIHYAEDCLWLVRVMMNMNKAVVVNEAVYCYEFVRNSSAHQMVHGSGNAKLAEDAVLAFETVYSLMKEKGLSNAENAVQRKLNFQKLACRGVSSSGSVSRFLKTGKGYVGNIAGWAAAEKSFYGFGWASVQLASYYMYFFKTVFRSMKRTGR